MYMPKDVQFLELSPEKIEDMWAKINPINGLFDDFSKGRFDMFIKLLQSPNTVWLERTDGNGILYLTQVVQGLSANGHIIYWDRRLRGREEFTLNCMRWLMSEIPLKKLNVYLPDYASAAKAFIQRLRFRKEGVLRRYSISNGRMFNMEVYGMTVEEAFDERLHGTEREGVSRPTHGSGVATVTGPESTTDGSPGDGHDTTWDGLNARLGGSTGGEPRKAVLWPDDGRAGESSTPSSPNSTAAGGQGQTATDTASDGERGADAE